MPRQALRKSRYRDAPDGSGWFDPALEYYFDDDAAQLAVDFFPTYLSHGEGEHAGKAFELEPWQRDRIVRPLFGWMRADGTRKYRSVWVEVPRKNGKSPLAAGVALKLTFADFEPGAQVYSTGADRDQARVVFSYAAGMRARNEALRRRSLAFRNAIVVPALGATYKALSADAGTKHGLNTHGVVNDEVHAQRTRELYDTMHTSTSARRQPVEFNITTAGWDRHSIAYELHAQAEKVAAGILHDDSLLPVIYAAKGVADDAGPEDDWTDPAVWAKANPNLGVSKKLEYMRQECRRAQDVPGHENTFKQLDLNIWTEQAKRWLPMVHWDACAGAIPEAELAGKACFGGLDLANTTDIAALTLVFRLADDLVAVLPFFWVPEANIKERARRDRVPYDVWARQRFIRTTPGNVIDYDRIRADVNALGKKFRIRELAIDRWNATQLTTQLMGDGFTMVPFGQGFASMSAPSKELEKRITGRSLRHGGNPVLRWMASNAAKSEDAAGNIKPDKSASTEKIDGIVALAMALGRLSVQKSGATIDDWLASPA